MDFKDYYKILGVKSDASAADIKQRYRKLARKYHPDVSKEADAEARFKEVGEAFEALKTPEKRAAYDQVRANYEAGYGFQPPPNWQAQRGGGFGADDAGQFSDFFASIFGGGFNQQGGARPAARGKDINASVSIDLHTAFAGGKTRLSLQQANGAVKTLDVTIPKGITEGKKIRIAGQGSSGIGGGSAGDLLLEVQFRPHASFQTKDKNIESQLLLAPWEAATGATVPVETLGGKVELRIPPNSSSGKRMRLKGRGLGGGDHILELKIVVPKSTTPETLELYRQLAEISDFDPRQAN